MRIKAPLNRIRGWRRCYQMLSNLKNFSGSEIANQRLKIIEFYEQYGEKATKEAFGADRKVISRWRSRLKAGKGRLAALIPYSTEPNRKRQSKTPIEILEFIENLRRQYPRLGKDKIKIFLDSFCKEYSLKTISVSTIGNIIKKNNMFYQVTGKVYHDPDSKWAKNQVNRKKKNRVCYAPKNVDYGYIVSDTAQKITDGIKEYFYSAIDVKSRFAITLNYKELNSRNMKDFYERFKEIFPHKIKCWQSDNGAEHLGEFEQHLEKENIPHYFSYPRCPKINAHIERYNRTLKEEFVYNNLDIIHDKKLFNECLAEFVIFYNTIRPHHSLGLKTPLEVLKLNLQMSHKSVTYTMTIIITY